MMNEIREAVARALYECERQRSLQCEEVLSRGFGKPIRDTMEPWEDSAEIYREDASAALEAACEAIGWPQIHAYHAELRKGQDIYEDAGGFFARAIGALFGRPRTDPVTNYQDAARALVRHATGTGMTEAENRKSA